MIFREATEGDIPQMTIVRNSVKENALSDPSLITNKDYHAFLFLRGKGWVCETDEKIVGFSTVDLIDNNIWALFVLPAYEGLGIGKRLHDMMLAWYFSQTKKTVWLGTAFNTRAEKFYRMQGWEETGTHGSNEIKFEMSHAQWIKKSTQ